MCHFLTNYVDPCIIQTQDKVLNPTQRFKFPSNLASFSHALSWHTSEQLFVTHITWTVHPFIEIYGTRFLIVYLLMLNMRHTV